MVVTRPSENPFRSSRISTLPYRFDADFSWPALLSRLQEMNHRGALVGAEGSGKTTLLEQLEAQLKATGHRPTLLRASQSGEIQEAHFDPADFLLIDSAERLSWWQWLKFKHRTRHCAGLVITAHRPGLLPTLWTCQTSAALFEILVDELLAQAPLDQLVPKRDLIHVFERHQGNVRTAFRELYDRVSANDRK